MTGYFTKAGLRTSIFNIPRDREMSTPLPYIVLGIPLQYPVLPAKRFFPTKYRTITRGELVLNQALNRPTNQWRHFVLRLFHTSVRYLLKRSSEKNHYQQHQMSKAKFEVHIKQLKVLVKSNLWYHFYLCFHNFSKVLNLFPPVPMGNVFGVISGNYEWKLYLLYKHQWNTKWAFPRKLHIFTREDNMLSSHVKRSRALSLLH